MKTAILMLLAVLVVAGCEVRRPVDQAKEMGKLSFKSGALALAYAIHENPDVQFMSGEQQLKAAGDWWLRNTGTNLHWMVLEEARK